MQNSPLKISKTLLDLASVSEAVLQVSPKGRAALKDPKLEHTQRRLLERIDGFRSLDQLLAMSSDLIAVHAALGKLLMSGSVITDTDDVEEDSSPTLEQPVEVAPLPVMKPRPAPTAVPAPKMASAKPAQPASVPSAVAAKAAAAPSAASSRAAALDALPSELDSAKRLLLQEAKNVLGNGAAKLKPRIEACRSIEEIYDLIVKFQEHLTTTGKADPAVFLDRLTRGLADARQQTTTAKLLAAE